MDDIVRGLNPAQRDAVTSSSSVLQVLAPPGSGKTKTLTARVAYLIAHEQLKPWNIITCTFTKKAANEMKERIRSFVGEELSKQIKLGTFHAIAAQYLRQYGQHIGLPKDFGIADTSDSKAILKRIIKKGDFGLDERQALARISSYKSKGIDCEQLLRTSKKIEQQEFAQIFTEYEAELKTSNLLDYDDLLLRCVFLMKTHPECVSNVQAVLIDEFQDTNSTQYELMRLFAQKRNVITIVGDPDQSIYGFRNAEIKNLHRMKEQWPDTLTINLKENYRSSGAILHAAQKIIEQDERRPPKKLQATHSPGQRPVLRKLPKADAEATWLVSEIKRIRALSGNLLTASDFAILLRSAALSRVIESALGREGVPYRMVGGFKFFDRAEVKLVLDYLRVINQPNNSEAVERIINVPSRRVGDSTIKSLHEEANSKGVSMWALVCDVAQGKSKSTTKLTASAERGLAKFANVILSGQRKAASPDSELVSVVDLINLIIKKIDLHVYLKEKFGDDYDARWSNIEELIAMATDASDPQRLQSMMEENSLPTVDSLEQRTPSNEDALSLFLANVALSTAAEQKSADGTEPAQQVTISTIHSAKGLEWPIVFIPACFEGSIPHSRSDDNDEERRLLYVGMTRAQAMLYLSCPIKNTQREDTTMSSFLTQPGVASYFEEHGPSMCLKDVNALATTLRRDAQSAEAFERGKKTLERDEDNYWPLDGEQPAEERAKWDYGKAKDAVAAPGSMRSAPWATATSTSMQQQPPGFSTATATMNSGFVSVKDNYEEILEQNKLKAIDKRAMQRKNTDIEAPKGRKRQIEGRGTIASFFKKPKQVESRPEPVSVPLQDISNFGTSTAIEDDMLNKPVLSSTHKLRTAPLRQKPPGQPSQPDPGYMFLSSSPSRPEDEENEVPHEPGTHNAETDTGMPQASFRPATTFHTTSVQAVRSNASHVKRLGVKPSFNGWANRARK